MPGPVRRILLVAVLVSGCASVKPPPSQPVAIGGINGEFRDWRTVDACKVSPKELASELNRLDVLLSSYLQSTSAGKDGVWDEEHLRILADSQRAMPPVLDAETALTDRLAACRSGGLSHKDVDLLPRATELIHQARLRVDDSAVILAHVKQKHDLEAWQAKNVTDQQSERGQWCPPKPEKGPPTIFYAYEDEVSRTQWLFCDGSKVVSDDGASPAYVAPEEPPAKHWKPAPAAIYIKAVSSFPAEYIRHAPKLPAETRP